jgi:hypothetical protein
MNQVDEATKRSLQLAGSLRRMKRKLFLSHVNENRQMLLVRTFSESSIHGVASQVWLEKPSRLARPFEEDLTESEGE